MAEYKAQLLAVEAKLAKEPENEELLSLKADLIELIELSSGVEEEEAAAAPSTKTTTTSPAAKDLMTDSYRTRASGSKAMGSGDEARQQHQYQQPKGSDSTSCNPVDKNSSKRQLSEAELLAKKKEKNRKKKAKLRERIKEQLDIAESEKQSWQSFANKKGLKGVTKKSIFASPHSVAGKVGVGTNGIADAPSAAVSHTKRKY